MNTFRQLQDNIRTRLARTLLAQVPVVTEDQGDVEFVVDHALSQGGVKQGGTAKVGLAILVLTPRAVATRGSHGLPSPIADITVTVVVMEKVVINRDASGHGTSALDATDEIIRTLHGWYDAVEPTEPVTPDSAQPYTSSMNFVSLDSADAPGITSYAVEFTITKTLT